MEKLSSEVLKNIQSLYEKSKQNEEFEFIIRSDSIKNTNIGFIKYERLLNYLKYRNTISPNPKIVTTETLDINFSSDSLTGIRATITGIENINNILAKFGNMEDETSFFNKAIDIDSATLMEKKKEAGNTIDIDEYSTRVRLSKESPIDKSSKLFEKIKEEENGKFNYRFKHRISLLVVDDQNEKISIDLTSVRQSPKRNILNTKNKTYEVEVELMKKKNNSNSKSLTKLYEEVHKIIKVMERTQYLIPTSEKRNILIYYADLMGTKSTKSLDGRKPVSLEKENVKKDLPNKYMVTDKADGNRHFLIIFKKRVYLISFNMNVIFTGIELKNEDYHGTILDGEYLIISGAFVFLAFDCLFHKREDVRKNPKMIERLRAADDTIANCFVFKNHKNFDFNEKLPETKTIQNLSEHLKTRLKNYMSNLNNDIQHSSKFPLIRRKYFADITGIDSGEIFAYASVIWNSYVLDSSVGCPYHLDGLIFQPQQQAYITAKKHPNNKYPDYKWKPREHNSIDFYVTIDSKKNGEQNIYYDNTITPDSPEKPYKIIYLHVGKKEQGNKDQIPVPFMEKTRKHIAHIFLQDNEARDENGFIIQNKSIVEFTYDSNPKTPQAYRWIPRNIRFDKTERLEMGIKEYGNYFTVAKNVWETIHNPLTIEDIENLGKGIDLKASEKKDTSIITKSKDGYYQNIVTIAIPMKRFHNFIKSNMIKIYCSKKYFGKDVSVLDLACGRGGDIDKMMRAKISSYVGVDIDKNNLLNNIDGAIVRFNQMKRKMKKGVPRMVFIQGDAGALLNVESQQKALTYMTKKNNELMLSELEGKKFDVINCQFAVHYLLKDDLTWNNFITNINTYLNEGGLLLLTTFDASRVDELFKDGSVRYDAPFTNSSGKTMNLFTIKKQYDSTKKLKTKKGIEYFGTGNAISYTNILMFTEDTYHTEYLVDKYFIYNELKEKCNMELVETNLFENDYSLHEKFFKMSRDNSIDEFQRKRFTELSNFYDMKDQINVASHKLMRLNRYYVFRKKKQQPTKGGKKIVECLAERTSKYKKHFQNECFLVDPRLKNKYSFISSLHSALKEANIAEKNIPIQKYFLNKRLVASEYEDIKMSKKNIDKIVDSFGVNITTIINGRKRLYKKSNEDTENKSSIYIVKNKSDEKNYYRYVRNITGKTLF